MRTQHRSSRKGSGYLPKGFAINSASIIMALAIFRTSCRISSRRRSANLGSSLALKIGLLTHHRNRTINLVDGSKQRRGRCRQRLSIAGTVCSACSQGGSTRPPVPGAKGETLGYYGPSDHSVRATPAVNRTAQGLAALWGHRAIWSTASANPRQKSLRSS